MTQTIALHGSTPEVNPLYLKLRRRFAIGDRTIGEAKAQQAIEDGYQPYANITRRASSVSFAAERHMSRANSLPAESRQPAGRSFRLSGGAIAVLILCAFFLLFLLVFGAKITELNREIQNARNASELRVEEKDLTVVINGTNPASASGLPESDAPDALYTANLLESFERN